MSTEHNRDSYKDEFITVNQVLNTKPQLGPIPGEQVIPWIGIAVISYFICQGVLSLSWATTLLVAVWGIATWWTLTGDESWKFLSKLKSTPHWVLGHSRYECPYSTVESPQRTKSRSKSKKRSRKHDRSR